MAERWTRIVHCVEQELFFHFLFALLNQYSSAQALNQALLAQIGVLPEDLLWMLSHLVNYHFRFIVSSKWSFIISSFSSFFLRDAFSKSLAKPNRSEFIPLLTGIELVLTLIISSLPQQCWNYDVLDQYSESGLSFLDSKYYKRLHKYCIIILHNSIKDYFAVACIYIKYYIFYPFTFFGIYKCSIW